MKAVTYRDYGTTDVLRIEDVDVPTAAEGQVLVAVRAASVNAVDWHRMTGLPYLVRASEGLSKPKSGRLGADLAGIVSAIGPGVTRFGVGDEVFGQSAKTLAEYAVVKEEGLVRKPSVVTFEQAAAIPLAAGTALQGLRDHGGIASAQRVLICGAGGGVGTFAVQLARILGAEVTATSRADNLELLHELGATRAIDYEAEDVAASGEKFDLIFDLSGRQPIGRLRRILTDRGSLVLCGAPKGEWIAPIASMVGGPIRSVFSHQRIGTFLEHRSAEDLVSIAGWVESSELRAVIDSVYPFSETAVAIRHLQDGPVTGKVVVVFGAAKPSPG